MPYRRKPMVRNRMLPVDIVLGPPWWYHHEGITFDADHFYHPARRVEAERKMEDVLYERWGRFGLGEDHGKDLPVVGPVHLAAGYLISEMLGCRVDYLESDPPQVKPRNLDKLEIDPDAAFESPAYKRTAKALRRPEDQARPPVGRHQLGRGDQRGPRPARGGDLSGHVRPARGDGPLPRPDRRGDGPVHARGLRGHRARPRSRATATCGTSPTRSSCTASAPT